VAYDWRFWVPFACAVMGVLWFPLIGVSLWMQPGEVTGQAAWASNSSDGSAASGTTTTTEPPSHDIPWFYIASAALTAAFALLGAAAREWGLVAVIGAGLVVISLFNPYFALLCLPAAAALLVSATLGAALG
jgi:hypothetical protein